MQNETLFRTILSKRSWQKKGPPKFNFIDLFAGIGGFRIALEGLGGECVFSSEWDERSQETYFRNFGEVPHGDITKIKEKDIPKHNVLCAGFPCQAFSVSGKRLGFNDTRGTLFFDVARIAKYAQPEILFLENVKNLVKHENGNTFNVIKKTLDEIGYDYFIDILKSSDFGVPQARERVYIIAFRKDLGIKNFSFPPKTDNNLIVRNILEKSAPEDVFIKRADIKFFRDDKDIKDPRKPFQIGVINKGGQGERIYSINASGITLSAYGGGAASKTGAFLVDGKVRKLMPRECARMQGFPEDFELPRTANLAYKQFGDSVSVPVLTKIFGQILDSFPRLLNVRKTK